MRWPSLRKVISSSSHMERSSSTTRICAISLLWLFTAVFVACIGAPSSHARQLHNEFRATVFLRNHADPSAVGLHDLIDNRESQAGSALKTRLQRLKDLCPLFGIKPDAGIAKGDAEPKRALFQADRQRAAVRHRPQCVVAQVPEH